MSSPVSVYFLAGLGMCVLCAVVCLLYVCAMHDRAHTKASCACFANFVPADPAGPARTVSGHRWFVGIVVVLCLPACLCRLPATSTWIICWQVCQRAWAACPPLICAADEFRPGDNHGLPRAACLIRTFLCVSTLYLGSCLTSPPSAFCVCVGWYKS